MQYTAPTNGPARGETTLGERGGENQSEERSSSCAGQNPECMSRGGAHYADCAFTSIFAHVCL